MRLDDHTAKRKIVKTNDLGPKTNLFDRPDTISLKLPPVFN